jgi:hypothetical protein
MVWNRTRIFQTDQVPLLHWFPSRDFSKVDILGSIFWDRFSGIEFTQPLAELMVWARVCNIRAQGCIFSCDKKSPRQSDDHLGLCSDNVLSYFE